MNQDHLILVAKDLNIAVTQVAAAAKLLEEGATVPFIARYRKEATGTLDEVQIAKIRDDLERLKAIERPPRRHKKDLCPSATCFPPTWKSLWMRPIP